MAYSFIEPRPKSPFGRGFRQIWAVTALLLLIIGGTAYGLHVKNTAMAQAYREGIASQNTLKLQRGQLQQYLRETAERKALFEEVHTSNQLLKEQLSNLLELIPDSTTLSRFDFRVSSIGFYGVTKEPKKLKEIFETALKGQYRLQRYLQAPKSDGTLYFESIYKTVEQKR